MRPVLSLVRAAIRPAPALMIFVALWGLFLVVLHPWFMNWGSTPEEQAMVLPGDTAPPSTYFTRAITINAPPAEVWPWLLAIGQDRAGFLSNDYLENLTGADIHNAVALRPEWQQRALGDRVPMASPGMRALGGDLTSTTIHLLEPERAIADTPGRFVLLPVGSADTRLLLRESLDDPIRGGAAWLLWDPMHFVMEQRMLQGIKERAEGRPLVPPGDAARGLGSGWGRSVRGIRCASRLAAMAGAAGGCDASIAVADRRRQQLPGGLPGDRHHPGRVARLRLALAAALSADCLSCRPRAVARPG